MTKSDLAKRFGKSMLIDIASELGIEADRAEHIYAIIEKLVADMEENGLPDPSDCSDELFDFMVAVGYIDENGNVLEEDQQPEEKGDVQLPGKLPGCWSRGDAEDAQCKKCKLLGSCLDAREKNRKLRACFGVLYKPSDEKCKMCLDWKDCNQLTTQKSN